MGRQPTSHWPQTADPGYWRLWLPEAWSPMLDSLSAPHLPGPDRQGRPVNPERSGIWASTELLIRTGSEAQ
jgi:hypothetical protein